MTKPGERAPLNLARVGSADPQNLKSAVCNLSTVAAEILRSWDRRTIQACVNVLNADVTLTLLCKR